MEGREWGNERKSARVSGRVREARLKIPHSLKLTFMGRECDRVIETREESRRKREWYNHTGKVMVRTGRVETNNSTLPSSFFIPFSPVVPY